MPPSFPGEADTRQLYPFRPLPPLLQHRPEPQRPRADRGLRRRCPLSCRRLGRAGSAPAALRPAGRVVEGLEAGAGRVGVASASSKANSSPSGSAARCATRGSAAAAPSPSQVQSRSAMAPQNSSSSMRIPSRRSERRGSPPARPQRVSSVSSWPAGHDPTSEKTSASRRMPGPSA